MQLKSDKLTAAGHLSVSSRVKMKLLSVMGFLSLLMTIHVAIGDEEAVEEPMQEPKLSQESEAKSSANDARSEKVNAEPPTDSAENSSEEDKTYALGSLCNYCTYCKVGILVKLYAWFCMLKNGRNFRARNFSLVCTTRTLISRL